MSHQYADNHGAVKSGSIDRTDKDASADSP